MSDALLLFRRLFMDVHVINILLCGSWVLLVFYCQMHSYFDPSSIFYRSQDAYKQLYSAVREEEASNFLSTLHDQRTPGIQPAENLAGHNSSLEATPYCLGVPSLRRERERFLGQSLASVVDTLEREERVLIHIVVLLSDEDPTENPAFGQPWLHAIADVVLVHEGAAASPNTSHGYSIVPRLPHALSRDEHVRRDYAALATACRLRNSAYFILIEDDVIASRDWFSRLQRAIPQVSTLMSKRGQDWLYLRLFYSEIYMGWNSEELPVYIRNTLEVYAFAIVVLLLPQLLACVFPMATRRVSRSWRLIQASILLVWLPLFIALYFMAGRLLVNPYPVGVQEMPRYGCCSQGLVLPARHLPMLESNLLEPPYTLPADTTIEKIAEEQGLMKLALVPSVLQHVGVRGSSAEGGKKKLTWNFSFERNPA